MELIKQYWPLLAIALWFGYKWWNTQKIVRMLPELRKKGVLMLDVRSQGEYMSGHAPGTLNIPLNELGSRLNEIPKDSPLIVCCATGTRSGMAKMLLKKNGFNQVYNIGSWYRLN